MTGGADLISRIAGELYSSRVEGVESIPSDESHVYRLVLGDGRRRIVKVDRQDWTVVAKEQVAFPALREQGLTEFPEIEFTQDDLPDSQATFMVMPETRSIPPEELWRAGLAPAVVARTGDFLRRLSGMDWETIPGARSPEGTSRDLSSWFRNWFAPLGSAPWCKGAAMDLVGACLRSLGAPPTQFGGWQFGQLLTDGSENEFTVIDWTNLGAYWSLNDVASTIASLDEYHDSASNTLAPVLLDAYTGGQSLTEEEGAELALWQAKWLLFSSTGPALTLASARSPGAQGGSGASRTDPALPNPWLRAGSGAG